MDRPMQCESVEGCRMPDVHGRDDETGHWHKPPGTWRWRLDGPEGARVMEAVLPTKYPDGPGMVHQHIMCDCPVVVENSPYSGRRPIWYWDGNIELPTLKPSIGSKTTWGIDDILIFWHGYMEAGNFRACE